MIGRLASTIVVVLTGTALAGSAQVPAKPAASEALTGVIRGRVIAADTRKPLRRARVRIMPGDQTRFDQPLTANTNSRGEFEVTGIAPGSYFVSGSRAGYLTIDYGQRRAHERGIAVEVRGGEVKDRIVLTLPRGGVLTGRITDEVGEAYPGVRVDALASRFLRGRRVPFPAGVATTDDLGNFRISRPDAARGEHSPWLGGHRRRHDAAVSRLRRPRAH
jgi:hypothetical protein